MVGLTVPGQGCSGRCPELGEEQGGDCLDSSGLRFLSSSWVGPRGPLGSRFQVMNTGKATWSPGSPGSGAEVGCLLHIFLTYVNLGVQLCQEAVTEVFSRGNGLGNIPGVLWGTVQLMGRVQ